MRDRLPDLTAVSRKPHSGLGRQASSCGLGQRPQEEPGELGWKDARRGVQKQDPRSLSRGPGGESRRRPWGGSFEEERPWRELGSVSRRESNKRVLGVLGPPEASVSPGVAGRSLQEESRQPPSRVPGSFRFFKSHKMHKRNPIGVSEQSLRGRALGFLVSSRVLGWGFRSIPGRSPEDPGQGCIQVDSCDKAPGLPCVPRVTVCWDSRSGLRERFRADARSILVLWSTSGHR